MDRGSKRLGVGELNVGAEHAPQREEYSTEIARLAGRGLSK